jgi:putative ABC transport system ATP-binding protein
METASTYLIETRELTKVYLRKSEAQVKAVDGVNLKIYRGEFLAIVGRSGSGKTTLLNLIGTLDRPTSGAVIFEGRALCDLSNRELTLLRRQKVGLVFQTFNLLSALTALENITVALAPTRMSMEERQEKARTLLDTFELSDRADRLPLELSVGQQQKLAIARALINDPVLILADEPTGEMDPITGREIVAKLVELNRNHNVTLVVTSHGTFPYDRADRVLFLKDGRLVSKEEAGY